MSFLDDLTQQSKTNAEKEKEEIKKGLPSDDTYHMDESRIDEVVELVKEYMSERVKNGNFICEYRSNALFPRNCYCYLVRLELSVTLDPEVNAEHELTLKGQKVEFIFKNKEDIIRIINGIIRKIIRTLEIDVVVNYEYKQPERWGNEIVSTLKKMQKEAVKCSWKRGPLCVNSILDCKVDCTSAGVVKRLH